MKMMKRYWFTASIEHQSIIDSAIATATFSRFTVAFTHIKHHLIKPLVDMIEVQKSSIHGWYLGHGPAAGFPPKTSPRDVDLQPRAYRNGWGGGFWRWTQCVESKKGCFRNDCVYCILFPNPSSLLNFTPILSIHVSNPYNKNYNYIYIITR